jgi:hypothetical protein
MVRMRRSVVLTAASLSLSLAPTGARAQLIAPDSGSHVRIGRVGESTLQEGSFVAASDDSLSMSPGSGLGVVSLPIRSIQTLDVSSGPHVNVGRVLKGAAVGAGIAIVGTIAATALACATDRGGDGPTCAATVLIGPPLLLIGIGVGAWIGADRKENDWRRVYDRGLTTGLYLGPAPRGGIAIGMTIAFDVPAGSY